MRFKLPTCRYLPKSRYRSYRVHLFPCILLRTSPNIHQQHSVLCTPSIYPKLSNLAPYWQYHPSPYYLHMPHHHHLSSAQAHVGSGYVVSYLLPTTNKPLEYSVDVPNNSLPPVFLASLPLKKNNPRCPRIPQIPYTTFRLDTGHITRKASPHPSFAHFQEELPSVAHLSHLNPS